MIGSMPVTDVYTQYYKGRTLDYQNETRTIKCIDVNYVYLIFVFQNF